MATVAYVGVVPPQELMQSLASVEWLALAPDTVNDAAVDLLLMGADSDDAWQVLSTIRQHNEHTPAVILSDLKVSDEDSLRAFERGADDILDTDMAGGEKSARIRRLLDDEIAAKQLRQQAHMANEVAMQAMNNSADLGETIQFFIDSQSCTNLDLLGMRFFQALRHFQISCSLQMRSAFGVKNMEANGLSRVLEAKLLWQAKDDGRYVDFGRRSIMNYESVSLLVRNMPDPDSSDYGRLKDTLFTLLQALHARVSALDMEDKNQMQTQLLRQLVSVFMQRADHLNESVYQLVSDGAKQMSTLADNVEVGIGGIDMSEAQEAWLLGEVRDSEKELNRLLAVALKTNESFRHFVTLISEALNQADDSVKRQTLLKRLLDNGVE